MLHYLSEPAHLYGLLLDELSIIPTDNHIIAVDCDKVSRFMECTHPEDGPYFLFLDDFLPLHVFFKATVEDANSIALIRQAAGLPDFEYLSGIPVNSDGKVILTPQPTTQVQ